MADSQDTTTPPSGSPAFQFYPKDFLGDGDQAGMSLQETGAYARLMCFEWNAHGNGIPDDAVRAANMVHAQVGAMRKMWPAIRSCFVPHPTEAGRLVHPRLEKERAKQGVFRRRQSDASKKRWDSRGNAVASERHIPQSIPKASSPISSLQSSNSVVHPRKEREGVPHTRGGGAGAGTFPRDHMAHTWCGRVCVPDFLHSQFERATGQSEAVLKAFYVDTFDGISEDDPVEPDAPKFWRPRVSVRWPPTSPSSSLKPEDLVMTPEERAADDARYSRGRR